MSNKSYDLRGEITRECGCGETDINMFYKNKANFGGLDYTCKKCRKEIIKNWRRDNPQTQKEMKKRYLKELGGYSGYYKRHKETMMRAQKKYNNTEKGKIHHKLRQHKYRKRKINAVGNFTSQQWESILEYYCPDNKCLKCNKKVDLLAMDHIIPLFIGGSNYIINMQPLCKSCNSSKGSRNSYDYRPDKGKFAESLMGEYV